MKQISNPPQPFFPYDIEWLDDPPSSTLQVFEEQCKSILSKNTSDDIPFTYSINPYRGCHHGCAYCYARPSHQYLDFGAGTDFESKIVVKVNAPERLLAAFQKKSWAGEGILFSGNTDCYQPLEARYGLTRRCLEICARYGNPVSVITKGALIRRDIALLQALHREASVAVYFSIPFADRKTSRAMEPYAPGPRVRFAAMRALHEAGIPVGVSLAPIIPGLNESDIPRLLKEAAENGASRAFMTLLRLPGAVEDVFVERLLNSFPHRANRVLNQIREMKGGRLNRSEFGARMKGSGTKWDAIEWMFYESCKRHDMNTSERGEVQARNTFKRPGEQMRLFDQIDKQRSGSVS